MTMASNLVARHLQVAYVVPTHRTFLVSGSPSEPFLVEAAARIMATPGFNTIDCLLRFTDEGLLDPGESSDIVGCTLMIDAYDAALRARMPTSNMYSQVGKVFVCIDFALAEFERKPGAWRSCPLDRSAVSKSAALQIATAVP